MRLLHRFLCFVCLGTLCVACDNCGSYDEPKLNLFISSALSFQVDMISAFGTTATFSQPDLKTPVRAIQFSLPLSLVADSTRYTLVVNGKPETLTVHYKRTFAYRDRKCGYQTNLYPPANTTQARQVQVSVGKIANLQYLPIQTGRSLFGNLRTDDSQILLSISL